MSEVAEIRSFEIKGYVYSSFLPPRVTHGMVAGRADEMTKLGYNEVTIEGFGNVWTRTIPLEPES